MNLLIGRRLFFLFIGLHQAFFVNVRRRKRFWIAGHCLVRSRNVNVVWPLKCEDRTCPVVSIGGGYYGLVTFAHNCVPDFERMATEVYNDNNIVSQVKLLWKIFNFVAGPTKICKYIFESFFLTK